MGKYALINVLLIASVLQNGNALSNRMAQVTVFGNLHSESKERISDSRTRNEYETPSQDPQCFQENSTTSHSSFVRILQLMGHYCSNDQQMDRKVEGFVKQFQTDDGDGDNSFDEVPQGSWIAVFHCPHVGTDSDVAHCHNLMDKMRTAMLFGASAIIILSLTPKVLRDFDFNRHTTPVVIVDEISNITALLAALATQAKLYVEFNIVTSEFAVDKVTLWSTCWRSRPGSGVVCFYDQKFLNGDLWKFWRYVYLTMALFLVFLVIKCHGDDDSNDDSDKMKLHSLAMRAVQQMSVVRYSEQSVQTDANELDDHNICAICLDIFQYNQAIRMLPCVHEFHVQCVDRWLNQHYSCPLCKQSIIDQSLD